MRRALILIVRAAGAQGRLDPAASGARMGRGRTRFRLRLRPARPGALRRVVIAGSDYEGGNVRKVTVPVTR